MLGGEPAGAGDVVGVDVGVDHIAEAEAALREERLVLLDVDRRVDDRGLVTLAGGNQVGGAAAAFVEDLLEVHRRVPCRPLRAIDYRLSVEAGMTASRQDGKLRRSCGHLSPSFPLLLPPIQ